MLDKFLAQLVLALADFVCKRIERGRVAVDATPDVDRLRRAGSRINDWLQQNGARESGKPDSCGTGCKCKSLHPYRRGVATQSEPRDPS